MLDGIIDDAQIGVGCCGCPNSYKVSHMTLASCALKKRVPSSASAEDAEKKLKMLYTQWMTPLSMIDWPSIGMEPKPLSCGSAMGMESGEKVESK